MVQIELSEELSSVFRLGKGVLEGSILDTNIRVQHALKPSCLQAQLKNMEFFPVACFAFVRLGLCVRVPVNAPERSFGTGTEALPSIHT